MTPNGQAMMHIQQPTHCCSCPMLVTTPVSGSFCMQPLMQALTHSASWQWRHTLGTARSPGARLDIDARDRAAASVTSRQQE